MRWAINSAFDLGRLFGIQIRLHYSWFAIFLLITVSLSFQYFPFYYPGWTKVAYWAIGIVSSLLFFASVLAHELMHSLVSQVNGIPVRSITLFIFGGVAQITREASKASAELKMAAAGPATSLVIGGLFALVWLLTQGSSEPVAAMAYWLAYVNGLVAGFNLIPGFPLDGGRVFRSLLWRFTGNYGRATLIATRVGQGVGYLFILGGILIMFLLRDWLGGIWLAFIGWFLSNAALSSYRQTRWREALYGFTAADVMTADLPVVAPDITIAQVVNQYILPTGRRFFLIVEDGKLSGMVTLHNIKAVPQRDWDVTRVRGIMVPVDKLQVTGPSQAALNILEQMDEYDINQIPVVSGLQVIGVIARDNLLRFLRTRSELGI